MKKLIGASYFLVICAYAIFSFSLTDPNLVLTTWHPYWVFQQWMWQTFFSNAPLLSEVYTLLITAMFACYFGFMYLASRVTKKTDLKRSRWWLILLIALPLFFSYNALSHDIFNYIFNAKMVLVYHGNPQQQIALDFPQDSWVRFMHNTNTPAPYGYGWIGISLIPSALGFGKFTITWLLFRLFSVISICFLILSSIALTRIDLHKEKVVWTGILSVILNPLFLIEVISNSHNDVWMMAPALLSFAVLHNTKRPHLLRWVFSTLLLFFSISIKLSTVVLIPVWIAIFIEQGLSQYRLPRIIRVATSFIHQHYADVSALLLFIPLLTPRSQLFNSWYLIWLLVWIPFMRWQWLRSAVLVLSLSSLLRYLPWLLAGGFSDQIVLEQRLITFVPLVVFLIYTLLQKLLTRSFANSSVQ